MWGEWSLPRKYEDALKTVKGLEEILQSLRLSHKGRESDKQRQRLLGHCCVSNTTQSQGGSSTGTRLGTKKLQQKKEMQLASSMLASDWTSKLDKQKDKRVRVKMIKDISEVQPLVKNGGNL